MNEHIVVKLSFVTWFLAFNCCSHLVCALVLGPASIRTNLSDF